MELKAERDLMRQLFAVLDGSRGNYPDEVIGHVAMSVGALFLQEKGLDGVMTATMEAIMSVRKEDLRKSLN